MNQTQFEALLAQEAYAPAVRVEQPVGYQMGEHQHPFDAFALIIAGEIVLEVNGQRTAYGAGSTFQLPAHTMHSESALEQGVTYLAGRRMPATSDQ